MMMMMCRVMCVLAVVLCCACGYTMAAAAAVDNDSPSGRGVSRGAVEVSCGAGGALRVRPAAESEWLTCGAGSRVSACGKYADLCRQRTTRGARATTIATTTTVGQPKAVMATFNVYADNILSLNITPESVKAWNKSKRKANAGPATRETREDTMGDGIEEVIQRDDNPSDVVSHVAESQKKENTPGSQNGNSNSRTNEDSSPRAEAPHIPSNPTSHHQSTTGVATTSTGDRGATAGETLSSEGQGAASATTTTDRTSFGEDDYNQPNPQTQSENTSTRSQETNSTTPTNTEKTVEAPTTTPSPAPNAEISSIDPIVQQKTNANVDSSVSPVWMCTAAPLLIVAVLVSVTLY
ncbi:uncharacterized protein TM35_000731130 [Trypanosoma theileri]|uniref:Mucin-like glycoprotein n=1 Tax=Trypanosoma theileri TaxID=67003 RepID=A0A1X0NGT1_9TRYP|nr:uncharacterized protein TM35_000731130 [Trypanosoma theileri]ORC83389.1 hypothetical protein TM35_000731130 [Trypanosoma theileri]